VSFAKALDDSLRGATVQLEGRICYLANTRRSACYKLAFHENLGTGTFYASEAVSLATKIERRDGRVLFEWREAGKLRQVLVPEKAPIKDKVEEALKKWFRKEGAIQVPVEILDDLDEGILVTRLKIENGRVRVSQKRSDGTVELSNVYDLPSHNPRPPDTDEVSVFTRDLRALKGYTSVLYFNIIGQMSPLSVVARLDFGAVLIGLISHLVYEP
jgi:hypothetical protein